MVANRDSITKIAMPMIDLIEEGDGGSAKVMELAARLRKMLARSGTYHKQYASNEERVLNRHLNLYRNKLAAAKNDRERQRWTEKLGEQRRKVAAYEASQRSLDLDGL